MLIQLSAQHPSGSNDLVGLLDACHQRIRRFVALAREAALNRAVPPDQIAQACADVERYFVEALPLHVADEEESIQPRLRGLSPAVDRALDVMAHQHQQHVPKLEALLRATARVRSTPQDEGARTELAAAATALEAELEEHLALEERVIFPAIREILPREAQSTIIDELRQRRCHDPGTGSPAARARP